VKSFGFILYSHSSSVLFPHILAHISSEMGNYEDLSNFKLGIVSQILPQIVSNHTHFSKYLDSRLLEATLQTCCSSLVSLLLSLHLIPDSLDKVENRARWKPAICCNSP